MGKLIIVTEGDVQNSERLAATEAGGVLWRNNNGAYKNEQGRQIRYGIANDSKAVNSIIKSSDLLGITPVKITQNHVGTTLGVFTAIECKEPNWKFRESDKRAVAQAKFLRLVIELGGIARFSIGPNCGG